MKTPIWHTRTFWTGLSTLIVGILALFDIGGKYAQVATAVLIFLTTLFVRDAIETGNAESRKIIDVVAMKGDL